MTATEICEGLEASGCRIEVAPDGKASLVGKAPAELVSELKAQREAVLAEWERQSRVSRWGRVPFPELPLRERLIGHRGAEAQRRAAEKYVAGQPQVLAWVSRRAAAYFNRLPAEARTGDAVEQAMWTACLDLLAWQCRCDWGSALVKVEGIEEAVAALQGKLTTEAQRHGGTKG